MTCVCILLAACAAPPRDPLEGDLYDAALDRWLEHTVQLQRVHHHMRLGNQALCGSDVSPVLGLVTVRTAELPASLRAAGAGRFGSRGAPIVIAVLPGSAAEAAKLKVGDRVLRIGTRRVTSTRFIYAPPRRGTSMLDVKIARGDQILNVDIENKPGCDYRAELVDSDELNAFAVNKKIVFLAGLLRMLKEDRAIAFVMGHELAHHIAFRTSGRRSRNVTDEVHADYLGVYLAERGGYPLSLSDFGLVRAVHGAPARSADPRSTHPAYPARSVYLDQTLGEIADKRERGEPLIPRATP